MIISHKYRYLFVEIPLTASWAIRNELCRYYDGSKILHKHATYPEYRRIATDDEQRYFVFATVRNPLDEVVSRFVKLRDDHKGVFSDPESTRSLKADYSDSRKYEFIKNSNATFESFFRKYHNRPYGSLIDIASDRFDFVIRYESLQDGFSELLHSLGISQIRPIPVVNKTTGKKADWESYYTPEIREQAKRIFGPFMKKWAYEFPPDWGDYRISRINRTESYFVNIARNLYLSHFRYSDKIHARFVRSLRALLLN